MSKEPSSRTPTIHDVASALGMHKSTVSLALSGKGNISAKTRARVLAVTHELDYQPNPLAQRLASGSRNSTVCLFSGLLDVGLATEKILLIQKEMSERSFETPIYTCPEPTTETAGRQAAQLKQLCRQRPRAIICAAQRLEPSVFRELEIYQDGGGIVISYDSPIPLACDQVIFDREDNTYQGARHLLQQGHRRIGIGLSHTAPWLSDRSDFPHFPQAARLRGFERALEEVGAPIRPDWFFRNPTYEKGGAEMARQFLQMMERPTGICVVNDYVALAFMVEVMRAGVRVPQDVSIVGHDNQPISAYCPVPLTSISHPATQIAQAVVDLLCLRLAGSLAPPQTQIITGQLVLRASVAPPL